jgi:RNA polymerase sigma-70 factor (ECF subfamily)
VTTLLTGGGARGREALDDDVDLARDRVLVTRAQEGDRDAFDDLYMRYYRRLYRFCLRRLHDAHEAEDVAQEAFARAWRALPTFGGDRRFYPWLSVIASHLCTDVLRRRNRSTPVAEFHQSNVASTEDGGEELMLAAVDSDLVAKAFTRLSDRHQRILHLREGSGWSYQRIADHEGVGITAVETLLWRARQALKREFATLAGAEGRLGAWLGGALSLAGLKRLLHLPARAFRRTASTGVQGAAVAAGSAVAATAMVIGAVSSPAPTPVVTASAPHATFSQVPSTSLPLATSGTDASQPVDSTPSGGTPTGGGTGGGSLASPSLPAGTGGNTIGGTLQSTGGTLSNVSGNVQSGVNTLLGPVGLSAPVNNLVGGATSTVGNLLGSAGSLLGGGSASGSTTGGTSAGSSGSTGTIGNTLNNTLSTTTSLLGGL